MDRKKFVHIGAIIGLVTAVIACVTAFVTLRNEYQKNEQALKDQKDQLDQQLAAYQRQREIDVAAQREAIEAQQKAALCSQHQQSVVNVDQRFNELMSEHSVLLNFLKNCSSEGDSDAQGKCVAAVCAAAYIGAGSNCMAIGTDLTAIKFDLDRETAAASRDQCALGTSSTEEFFRR